MFFGAVISATGRFGFPKGPEPRPKLKSHFKHIAAKIMRNQNSGIRFYARRANDNGRNFARRPCLCL
jgi:hypothetical protein